MDRPFFSIIIPCYNSKPNRIEELLTSIYNAGGDKSTEIIIVDDRSDNKEYLDIVDKFNYNMPIDKDQEPNPIALNIKLANVPDDSNLIHCPANTRQCGLEKATGEWITFVDHDDLLIEGALNNIKKILKESGEQYILFSTFYMENMRNNEFTKMEYINAKSWMHGKFYNLDNLWKKYDLKFPINMESHEDVYMTNKINCIMNKITTKVLYLSECSYICRDFPDTTTNARTDDRTNFAKFINNYFNDYIDSSMEIYIEEYNKLLKDDRMDERDKDFYLQIQADSIMFLYFYIQGLKYNYKYDFNLDYETRVKKLILDFYKRFDMNARSFYNFIAFGGLNNAEWYHNIRDCVINYLGFFVETDNFYDFISKL